MIHAADPSYPLYPIALIVAATMLLLVLLTGFIRQRWNLGVTFLCFWLFFENLTNGLNAVIWADNADIKLYVYCDIGQSNFVESRRLFIKTRMAVTHMQLITFVVKPMSTLIITRRLYLMTNLQAVQLSTKRAVGQNIYLGSWMRQQRFSH